MPPATVNEETARALYARYDFVPVDPYPGNVSNGWRVRCTICGAVRKVRYSHLRRDPDRRRCKHGLRPNRVPAREAEALLKLCGYVPVEPYPGNVSAQWVVRCVACGGLRYLRMKDLRAKPDKKICKHSRTHRAWPQQ